MGEVFEIGADAAEDAEDRLDEERRLDQPAVDEMSEVVQVSDVVTLELKTCATAFAEAFQNRFDISESVSENTNRGKS